MNPTSLSLSLSNNLFSFFDLLVVPVPQLAVAVMDNSDTSCDKNINLQ